MKSFENKIAVITGGGTGMGRELVLQLARANCNVSMCDVIEENMDQTMDLAASINPNVKITKHVCDVSIKEQVEKFRDDVLSEQQSDSINLLFNNAGIGGGQSFIKSDIEEWEKVFAVCWYGVYFCSRAFMEALIKSDEGHLINTSSVNGFWASLGDGVPHTSYSAAKFAVKGFSEALLNDFKVKYFNDDVLTDIVTFPIRNDSELEAEIYISHEMAIQNAKEFKVSLNNEISRLIVHGILHLIGFNDTTKEKKKEMFEKQEQVISSFNKKLCDEV